MEEIKEMSTEKNSNLHSAKTAKNDEFYTQYIDIEKEMNAYLEFNLDVFRDKTILLPCDDPEWSNFTKYFAQNFNRFGIKKLISTSYNLGGVGKLFTLTNQNKKVDIADLKWVNLEGDGDFRSEEIKILREDADIIITNPPFSMFREFLSWITEAGKLFVLIGNQNAITYKDVFNLIKNNKIWLGNGFNAGNAYFSIPAVDKVYAKGVYDEKSGLVKFRNATWFTNIDHGRRHQPLPLMTMKDNIKFSKHKEIKGKSYNRYDNYDAIDVPFTNAIPGDYEGVMGVPITFLDKYCPEQFEIVKFRKGNDEKDLSVNNKCPYFRILIKNITLNKANK